MTDRHPNTLKTLAQVPARINKGKGFCGPDYAGCINSGRQPKLVRSRFSGKFFVGPDLQVDDALRLLENHDCKRVVGTGADRVYVSKGRGPALKHFADLCDAVNRANDNTRAAAAKARQQLKSDDPSIVINGALTLADLGA